MSNLGALGQSLKKALEPRSTVIGAHTVFCKKKVFKKGDYRFLLAYSDKLFICVMTLRKWMGVELFASLARRMMARECKLESNQHRLLLYFLSRPLDELYLPLNLKKMSLQNLSKFFIDFCTF